MTVRHSLLIQFTVRLKNHIQSLFFQVHILSSMMSYGCQKHANKKARMRVHTHTPTSTFFQHYLISLFSCDGVCCLWVRKPIFLYDIKKIASFQYSAMVTAEIQVRVITSSRQVTGWYSGTGWGSGLTSTSAFPPKYNSTNPPCAFPSKYQSYEKDKRAKPGNLETN